MVFIGLSLNLQNAFATDWFYFEVGASRGSVTVLDTEFNPVMPRAKMGVALYEGILLEVQYMGGGDDKVANTKMEIEEVSAAYLRLDTPFRGSMRLYVLLGSAETTLNIKGAGGTTAGSGTYKDFSWGVGIEDRVWSKYTLLTLEHTSYYNHDDVSIEATSLGFKLEF